VALGVIIEYYSAYLSKWVGFPGKLKRIKHLLLLVVSLERDGDGLAKHDNGGALQDGHTAQTLTLLEVLRDEGLLRLEHDLGHLVGLEVGGG